MVSRRRSSSTQRNSDAPEPLDACVKAAIRQETFTSTGVTDSVGDWPDDTAPVMGLKPV